MEVDNNTPFSQRSFSRKLLAVVIAIPFFCGAALIIGARFAFFIPREERNHVFLIGLAMVAGAFALTFAARWYRRHRARSKP